MRQNKFIATKDHFVMIAASNEMGDELWAGSLEYRRHKFTPRVANTIGFLIRGSANSFHNLSSNGENWQPYESATAPLALIRKNFVDFGLVSTSNDTFFGAIATRDSVLSGQTEIMVKSNLSQDEYENLSGSDTIEVQRKCKVHNKRDMNTFESIDVVLDINIVSDTEIELDGV